MGSAHPGRGRGPDTARGSFPSAAAQAPSASRGGGSAASPTHAVTTSLGYQSDASIWAPPRSPKVQVSGEGLDAAPHPAGKAGRAQAGRQRSVCVGTQALCGLCWGSCGPWRGLGAIGLCG